MAYDYGLVGGIGHGIQQGLLTYMKAKQLNRENQIQNLTAGVETDEDGNLKLNDQMQAQRQAQGAQAQHSLDNYNPQSGVSTSKRSVAKGLLNQQQEGLGDKTITDDMAGSDVDQMSTLLKPSISGGYLLAGKQIAADTSKSNAQLGADTKEKVANISGGYGVQKANIGAQAQMGRQSLMQERVHNQNLQQLNKDTIASGLITTYNNLQNSVSNFEKGGRTPQEFGELQQSLRSNLGIKGTSGVDERGETYWKSIGLSGDKVKQILFGDPVDVTGSDPRAVDMILGLAKNEMSNKQTQYQNRVNQLSAGHQSFYNQRPDLKNDYNNTIQGGNTQLGLVGNGQQGQPQGLVGGGQDQKVADYAKQNKLDYQHALTILTNRGYKANGQ